MSETETELLHALIRAVPRDIPDARIFRRNIINVETVHGARVRNGIPGQCDAYLLLRGGQHIEVETKSARGALREAQVRWRSWCDRWHVAHVVLTAKKNEQADETIARWIRELIAAAGRLTNVQR